MNLSKSWIGLDDDLIFYFYNILLFIFIHFIPFFLPHLHMGTL
uniref:Pea phy phytochrome apoprotein n=1 Tax=Pisum sativum TaxID=3888 RepID=Q5NV55_PEA|nr:hypothetical protein 3 - garden pea [Pisum sativum]CAA32240.1 unnamed protein product [Pisum sativum]